MKNLLYLLLFFSLLLSCDSFKDTEIPEKEPNEELVVPVVSVSLSVSVLELHIADSVQLVATVQPSDATYEPKWWSDSPETATVDNNGLVTAMSEGTANIYVEAGDQIASCAVTVSRSEFTDYIDEYGINHGHGVKIGESIWAPVNCGYDETDFRFGKLYQWGRKYGQGYSTSYDASVPEIVEGPISAINGQKDIYSNTFFTASESPYDWTSPQKDDLWNSGTEDNPVKTEYDPCPEGWRVPTYSELDELNNNYSSWTTNENGQPGYWFSGASSYTETVPQVFFPAAGRRYERDGLASHRGDYGGYWSSRPNSIYAYYLYFGSRTVYMYDYCRAHGFPVRCVQVTD